MPKYLKLLVKLGLTIAILFAIGASADFRKIFSTLSSVAPVAVLIGLVLALLQAVVSAARLSVVVALYERRLPLRDSFRVTLESMFFSQTFVSFLGGDALRIWRIRRCGLPLDQAASAIVLDRLIGITGNHAFLLATLPWLLSQISDPKIFVGLIVLATIGIFGFAVVLLLGLAHGRMGLISRLPDRARASRLVRLMIEAATVGRHFRRPGAKLLLAGAASVIIALINSAVFFVLLLGLGVVPEMAFGCALLVPAVLEIAMLPISIAGWGVREGVAIVAFSAFGVPAIVAFGSSVLFALIVLALGLVGGLLWLVDQREIGTLAAIEAEVAANNDIASPPRTR
jgi:glycosyltransferase 2 family protein